MHSCLYIGQVRHRRFTPRPHQFQYRLFYAYLDLDELDTVFSRRWLWSTTRQALARFKRSDYLGKSGVPLKQAVADRVQQVTGQRPRGPIRMLTHLRYFGFVFNPVTFYYCFDPSGETVQTIVAEITNTPWGERYAYVLPANESLGTTRHLRFAMPKNFHVSPFIPMDIDYQWYFRTPDSKLNVHMVNQQAGHTVFDATLRMTRQPISATNCARVLLHYPLLTMKVIGAIYWHALRLWLKRIPFYTHPPKLESTDTGGADSAKSL